MSPGPRLRRLPVVRSFDTPIGKGCGYAGRPAGETLPDRRPSLARRPPRRPPASVSLDGEGHGGLVNSKFTIQNSEFGRKSAQNQLFFSLILNFELSILNYGILP